jgi:quinol monooxygenase YgiN
MVILKGRLRVPAAVVPAFLEASKEVVSLSPHDPGCIVYTLNADVSDPEAFLFYEEWESRDTLQAHWDSAHVKRFGSILTGMGLPFPEITLYYSDRVETVEL